MSMAFDVRRVVAAPGPSGDPAFLSDGAPSITMESPDGMAVSDLWWIDAPPADAAAGGDHPGPDVWVPPPGGFSWRLVRLPAPKDGQWLRVPGDDDSLPGMHTTDTVDFVVVLDGQIALGLDDGEYVLSAGDTVVQRGTRHRWRVVGERPCTFTVVMVGSEPGAPEPPVALQPRATEKATGRAPRRLVTGTDSSGRSYMVDDGEPPVVFFPSGDAGSVMVDLWQTGGRVVRPDQGGDLESEWDLDPAGHGVAFRVAELPPGQDPASRGWHATPSIDFDVILSGRIELGIPGSDPVVLEKGDMVVVGGVEHHWQPLGGEPATMAAVMIYVPA
jgi:quercetin dioxygenase-like cupin family protein